MRVPFILARAFACACRYNDTYPLTEPQHFDTYTSYKIAMIADQDKGSKREDVGRLTVVGERGVWFALIHVCFACLLCVCVCLSVCVCVCVCVCSKGKSWESLMFTGELHQYKDGTYKFVQVSEAGDCCGSSDCACECVSVCVCADACVPLLTFDH